MNKLYSVVYSPKAKDDLKEIYTYIYLYCFYFVSSDNCRKADKSNQKSNSFT